jgi:hypothetical protein
MDTTEQFLDEEEFNPVVAKALAVLEGQKVLKVFAAFGAVEIVLDGKDNNLLVLEGSGDVALGSINLEAVEEHFGNYGSGEES